MRTQPKISRPVRLEIGQRAARYCGEDYIGVDYYRIRQKLFFPLPVRSFPEELSTVRGLPEYPYGIWFLWNLEDRIFALGWAAEIAGSQKEKATAEQDLEALAGWRYAKAPNLNSAHMSRILAGSLQWTWLSTALRERICTCLRQLVDDGLSGLPSVPALSTPELVCEGIRFPNIPTIGSLGLAIAAAGCCHPLAEQAEERARLMADLWLTWGEFGYSEGVSYDGYTCDFIMDWLAACSSGGIRRKMLAHPRLQQILEEIRFLGAPGSPENLAPLGDVEPYEMRFHYSFAAKYLHTRRVPGPFPFPSQAPKFLRSDALPYLPVDSASSPQLERQGKLQDAHYALVLNSGSSKEENVKVVASWSNSLMGHMQPDAGSIVVGAGGEWLLSDPGYRQYMPTAEKDFTLGSGSHNQPVINGVASSLAPKDRGYETIQMDTVTGIRLNLGPTYADWKGSLYREILLDERGQLLINDHFWGEEINRIDYHWHGHPDGFWHVANGWAAILVGRISLFFTCCGHGLQPKELQRLRGSRGQLSIVKSLNYPTPRRKLTIQWIFKIAPEANQFAAGDLSVSRSEIQEFASLIDWLPAPLSAPVI